MKGVPFAAHRGDRRQDDALHYQALDRRGNEGTRRIRTHAAGVRPDVAVADALVVLRCGERQRILAVDQGEETRLLAGEKILDDDLQSGRVEPAFDERGIDRPVGGVEIIGDDHALAGRETVGLDDDRRAMARDKGFRRHRIAKAAVGCGRDLRTHAKVLGKALGGFDGGGRSARTEGRNPFRFERVDETQDERRFGTDHGEIDPLAAAKPDERLDVGRADRDALGFVGDPRIAGGAEQAVDQRRRRNRPGERVLASARTRLPAPASEGTPNSPSPPPGAERGGVRWGSVGPSLRDGPPHPPHR